MKTKKHNMIILLGIMIFGCFALVGCQDDEQDPLAGATINNANSNVEYVMPAEETNINN